MKKTEVAMQDGECRRSNIFVNFKMADSICREFNLISVRISRRLLIRGFDTAE